MNTDRRWLEARQLLADWFVPVSILLVVVALASGVAVYSTVATPAEPTEYDTVEDWSTTVALSHSAEVSEPNEVFSVGETLDDQPRYYTEVMPVLEGDIEYSYQAADGEVDVETEITQLTRAVEDGSGGEVVYWRDEQPLDATQTSELSPGESHNDSFAVDVDAMEQNATERAESLGSTAGTLETVVRIDVRMDGTIDGESVEHTEQYELPLEVTSGTYTVELPSETGHTEQQSVAVSTGWTDRIGDSIGLLVLLVVSVGSLGGLAAAKHRETLAPSPADRRAVETQSQRESLDEWISRGTLPSSVADGSRIEVASLTELVDVAIDSNRRVIDREDAAEYVVVDDTVLYGFTPEQPEKTVDETADTETPPSDDTDRPAVESGDDSIPTDDGTVDSES